MVLTFARAIKSRRRALNMTLKELSQKTGMSVGYLSMMERGLNSPTVQRLAQICDALGITMVDLLAIGAKNEVVVKAENRELVFEDQGMKHVAVTQGNYPMNAVIMTLSAEDERPSGAHETDLLGYVLEGSAAYYLSTKGQDFDQGTLYEIEEGDSIYIAAGTNYVFHKTSKGDFVSLWISNAFDDASQVTIPQE